MLDRLQLRRRALQCLSKGPSRRLLVGLVLMLPVAAYAFSPDPSCDPCSVPEPDTLALLGIGAAAWLAGKWLRR